MSKRVTNTKGKTRKTRARSTPKHSKYNDEERAKRAHRRRCK